MKLRFLFLFLFISTLFAGENSLHSGDVQGIMDQFFELHVDQDKISAQILERSLKIYLNQFDPSHAYLLQNEASTYIEPSQKLLGTMQADYEHDHFTTYFKLNDLIEESIVRARQWREVWERDPEQMVAEASNIEPVGTPDKSYARSLSELEERHYDRFLRYMAFQMEELGLNSYEGKEAKLVALCEKQIRIMENSYLGVDDQNHPLSEKEQEHQVVLRTLKALANSLDTHTAYYSPDEALAMKVQLEKGMCGIGVVLREGIDGIAVHEVIKGGPAQASGEILAGDTIIEVDGEPVQGVSFLKVLDMMRGSEGTTMRLGILRGDGSRPLTVELTRRKITLDDKRVDVKAEPYGDGVIGKITLHSFYEGANGVSSEQDLKVAIDELRAQGPLYGLVLDMRDNGGGFLSQAVKVSGLFISNGVVVISKYSDGSTRYYRAIDGERYYDGPLVVLISRGSASATEIVAQTLKDYGVAVVVGDEQTYGKGTIQHQTVTSSRADSFFKVTVGRYYTVSGNSTQIEGVKADILVPSPYQFEEIGEGFLENPLPSDRVAPAFQDSLADVDPFALRWFEKHYIPALQPVEQHWRVLLPQLEANSQQRVAENQNFQLFLQQIQEEIKPKERLQFGSNDLQMEESVNIVKDMIFLSHESN